MIDVAIIIVSYNVRDQLAATLHSLEPWLERTDLQIRLLVVDNQSHDGSMEMLQADFPWVERLMPGSNLGFAGGNNLALRELGFGEGSGGRADMVWLLNPDTLVEGEAPERLVAHLRHNSRVGAVGPRLQNPDGSLQHGAFGFPGLAQVFLDLFPVHRRLLESSLNGRYSLASWDRPAPFPVDMVLGAAMMVRGAAIDEVGLLDEGYFMYAEELDWCRRMSHAGWSLHAVPAATVVHFGGQSTRQFRHEMFVALWRARLRYYHKWHSPRYVWAVRAILRLAMRWRQYHLRRGAATDEGAWRLKAYQEVAAL
jgi:N-acetylglucosaminyl-diphospho-decaprenol L-rhamnosyltransferase